MCVEKITRKSSNVKPQEAYRQRRIVPMVFTSLAGGRGYPLLVLAGGGGRQGVPCPGPGHGVEVGQGGGTLSWSGGWGGWTVPGPCLARGGSGWGETGQGGDRAGWGTLVLVLVGVPPVNKLKTLPSLVLRTRTVIIERYSRLCKSTKSLSELFLNLKLQQVCS